MTLNDFIKKNSPIIKKKIENNLQRVRLNFQSPILDESVNLILDSSIGGKMIRSNLFLLVMEMFEEEITDSIFDVASAIEILNTGLLIHDDIMDQDMTRRNKDSVFASYVYQGRDYSAKDPYHYGSSMAICAGDIAFFIVYDILTACSLSSDVKGSLIMRVSSELIGVGIGQMMDVKFSNLPIDPSQKEIETINIFKTAKYTFVLPMLMACLIAKRSESELFEKIGLHMGTIYQLRDDELGIFGDENVIGKKIGSDIRENKKTAIRKHLYDAMDSKDRQTVDQIFGNRKIVKKDIDTIIAFMKKYRVQEQIAKMITSHKKEAEKIITTLSLKGLNTNLLNEVLAFINSRTK